MKQLNRILTITAIFIAQISFTQEICVKFQHGMGKQRKAFLARHHFKEFKVKCNCGNNGTKVKRCSCKISRIEIPTGISKSAAIEILSKEPFVKVVEDRQRISIPPVQVEPIDSENIDHEKNTWYLSRIHWHEAMQVIHEKMNTDLWNNMFPIIAVVDTGVDQDHEDLINRLLPGFNIIEPHKKPVDDNGHGTHCAGIIGAESGNKIGIKGVGYKCYVMPIKALGSDGVGYNDDIAKGIILAINQGAKVVLLSLVDTRPDKVFENAVKYAEEKDVLVVCAAGNAGVSNKHYPAAYDYAISVGAIDYFGKRASFSNYGRDWVNIAAPGTSIYSTFTDKDGNDIYQYEHGTSMAAPVVAGTIGLMRALRPNMPAKEIKKHLMDSCSKNRSTHWTQYGELDASAALLSLVGSEKKILTPVNPSNSFKSKTTDNGSERVEYTYFIEKIPVHLKELRTYIKGKTDSEKLHSYVYMWDDSSKDYTYLGGSTHMQQNSDSNSEFVIDINTINNLNTLTQTNSSKIKIIFESERSIHNPIVKPFQIVFSDIQLICNHSKT